jgi:hypothetical protein
MAVVGIGRLALRRDDMKRGNVGRVGRSSVRMKAGRASGRLPVGVMVGRIGTGVRDASGRVGRGTGETREFDATNDIDDGTGIPKGIPLIRRACSNSTSRFLTRTELGQIEQG